MATVWTIGFQGRSARDLLETLRAYRIGRVIDIRAMPIGEGDPFDQPRLSKMLAEAGISYDLRRELAPDRSTRASFASTGDLELMSKGYQSQVPRAALLMLAHTLEGQRCAIVSPERDPWKGHRAVLGRMLERMGFEIKHVV